MNNPRIKNFVRLDGQGRVIAGTNVARLKRPVTGHWLEIPSTQCCFPQVDVEITNDDITTDNTITIACDGDTVAVYTYDPTGITTIAELTAFLNANYSYLGVFTDDGTTVTVQLLLAVANTLCDDTSLITVETSTV